MKNIYVIMGEERFAVSKRINRLISESKADEFNISTYDLAVDTLEDALSDALMLPFIGAVKTVILKNPTVLTKSAPKMDYQMLLNYIARPMETTILIIDVGDLVLDESKDVVKALLKSAEVLRVKKPSDIESFGWLKMQCNFAGIEIKEDAIRTFFNLIGTSDLYKAKNEVDKLINYIGRGGVITSSDVKALVMRNIETDVYKLTNAIIEHDKSNIFLIYNDLLKSGNDPVKLLNLVSSAMRNNYVVSLMLNNGLTQADIATKLSISSGRAFYLVKNARSFKIETLEKHIKSLGDLDYKIKSGKVEPKSGFEVFLLNM